MSEQVEPLPEHDREAFFVRLLGESQVELALSHLPGASEEVADWLRWLIPFLAKYTPKGREFATMAAAGCPFEEGAAKILPILGRIFTERKDGRVLAAAVELAEELAVRGEGLASAMVQEFFALGQGVRRETVRVAAGSFLYGPSREAVELPAFEIDRFVVSNGDFEQMAPGHKELRDGYSETDAQPATYVNWYEAKLYARWCGMRLPSEQEWEKAASWGEGASEPRKYPWGDLFEAEKCNTFEGGAGKATPAGAYPEGKSGYGCEDMAGNVWEWTASAYDGSKMLITLRGGSWYYKEIYARCTYRDNYEPALRNVNTGFRCARSSA